MSDLSDWDPVASLNGEEEGSEKPYYYAESADSPDPEFLEKTKDLRHEIRLNPEIGLKEQNSFLKNVEVGQTSRSGFLLNDHRPVMVGVPEGNGEKLAAFVEEMICDLTPYESCREYVAQLRAFENSEVFDLVSFKDETSVPAESRKEDIEAIAAFLDSYGDRELVSGEEYLAFVFDNPERVDYESSGRGYSELGFARDCVNLDALYVYGWIGRQKLEKIEENAPRPTVIYMGKDIVRKYS